MCLKINDIFKYPNWTHSRAHFPFAFFTIFPRALTFVPLFLLFSYLHQTDVSFSPHFLWLFQYLAKFSAPFNLCSIGYVPVGKEKEKGKDGERETRFNWLMCVCVHWLSFTCASARAHLFAGPYTWCLLSCRCLRCMGDGPCQSPHSGSSATSISSLLLCIWFAPFNCTFKMSPKIMKQSWMYEPTKSMEILIWGPLPPWVHCSRRSHSLLLSQLGNRICVCNVCSSNRPVALQLSHWSVVVQRRVFSLSGNINSSKTTRSTFSVLCLLNGSTRAWVLYSHILTACSPNDDDECNAKLI